MLIVNLKDVISGIFCNSRQFQDEPSDGWKNGPNFRGKNGLIP